MRFFNVPVFQDLWRYFRKKVNKKESFLGVLAFLIPLQYELKNPGINRIR